MLCGLTLIEKLGGGEIDPDEPEPPQEAEKRESRRHAMRTLQTLKRSRKLHKLVLGLDLLQLFMKAAAPKWLPHRIISGPRWRK
jgi:hypothetical protein